MLAGKLLRLLSRVRTVVISFSELRAIDATLFHSYTFYEHVSPANNAIERLPENLFLTAVEANFGHNLIAEVPPDVFHKFEQVHLSYNRINWLHAGASKFDISASSKIDYSQNQLTDASSAKDFLPNHSTVLGFTNNSITYFDKDAFADMHGIKVRHNALTCDWRMRRYCLSNWRPQIGNGINAHANRIALRRMVVEKHFQLEATCPGGSDSVRSYLDCTAGGTSQCGTGDTHSFAIADPAIT